MTGALASAIVAGTGALWGLYWLPVRGLAALGLPGAWGTLAITLCAVALLAPVALARRSLAGADRTALVAVALGGGAFALYSVAFLYGRVALVILLWFLTPVWSTLIARAFLGWAVPPLRLAAIAVGLAGLGAMLGAGGGPPVPRDAGEWMGLAGGLIWAVSTTGIRTRPELPAVGAALVFALGAAVTAAVLSPFLQPVPRAGSVAVWPALGLALATASLFWVLSTAALIWAAARLEPARVGILLMTEVAVGAATAAWLDGERLAPLEVAGGALVLLAAVLELWPVAGTGRRRPRSG